MNFVDALHAQLEANPSLKRSSLGRAVKRADNASPSRQAKIYARLEQHARVHIGKGQSESVDWSAKAIDWTKLMELFKILLPIILSLFGL